VGKSKKQKPVPQRFVQIAQYPSLGIELTSGRPWTGIDQQVGHGSADGLFALTEEQYLTMLSGLSLTDSFIDDCWRGKREELRLFHPGGSSLTPEDWHPVRPRMLTPRFSGEIWRHVDALEQLRTPDAEPDPDGPAALSRALAAGGCTTASDPSGALRLSFSLTGDDAYPRPAALIAGLGPGSDRAAARTVLGEPLEPGTDVYPLEGDRVLLGYDGDALARITVERPAPAPLPGGAIRDVLEVLGEPEYGERFQRVAELAGATHRRWAVTSRYHRRLLAFEGGVELQVEKARVLSARILLQNPDGESFRHADQLLDGVPWPPTRAEVHRALGAPSATQARVDLHRYGTRELLVEYAAGPDGETPASMTAVLLGTSVSHGIHRWRSGEFALFIDALGLAETHPLVQHVRDLDGVRLTLSRGVVEAVEIGSSGYTSERFAAFVDGMSGEPTRDGLRLGVPSYHGDHDDLRDFEPGWIHIHSPDRERVATITVSRSSRPELTLRRWMFRDQWPPRGETADG